MTISGYTVDIRIPHVQANPCLYVCSIYIYGFTSHNIMYIYITTFLYNYTDMWHISQHNSITHNDFSRSVLFLSGLESQLGESLDATDDNELHDLLGEGAQWVIPVARWSGGNSWGFTPRWFHQNKSRDHGNDDLMVLNHVNTLFLLSYSNESPWVHENKKQYQSWVDDIDIG